MVVECKVASLSDRGSLADDVAYLTDCGISHFVEEGGSLVSAHGDFVGDEFDLWPTNVGGCGELEGYNGAVAQGYGQWWADITGMFLVSKSSNKTYGPSWIENVPNLEYGKGEPGDVYLPSQPGIVFIYGDDEQ